MARARGKDGITTTYTDEHLNQVAFPMGGMGAGMICLEGTGAFSHVSLSHRPNIFHEPALFAALYVKGAPTARLLEGPVPMRKAFGAAGSGNGAIGGRHHGLPRFAAAAFTPRFPFAQVVLKDKTMPVTAAITGWSPFVPGDADSASLPVAGLEYRLTNRTAKPVKGVFSFHAANFMRAAAADRASVAPMAGGFVLRAEGEAAGATGAFAAFTTAKGARADCAWFRGGWFDPLTVLWKTIASGAAVRRGPHRDGNPSDGGSLYVPFALQARAATVIRVQLAWHVPGSGLTAGETPATCACSGEGPLGYVPWYAARFRDVAGVAAFWRREYDGLRARTLAFSNCLFDTTLPAAVMDAVASNLTILKSPTVLRQHDGRLWGWEGCGDTAGCCNGTCTHVWNYAQALCHLFPSLERTLRETEFCVSQDERGHQAFRTRLPIGPTTHTFHAAADGQLGGIMKVHREWRISGDTEWLRAIWPRVRQSLDYCIATWDPDHTGTTIEPHHNTYDIEFWGADGMCTSFYLGALRAAVCMGEACGEDVAPYRGLLAAGRQTMESRLWNGAYFFQRVQWEGLRAASPTEAQAMHTAYSPEALAILKQEGPKYQYGTGCLSDGVLGDWLARVCAVPPVLDETKVEQHLRSVLAHNFKERLADHANPQRPGFAFGTEGGLILCAWPKGRKPALPFPYSDEVWTGIEYQVAAHLIMFGRVKEGLRVVETARERYDGRFRNPFNEYECGHWYARALSAYSLLQALSGARYDALEKTLYLTPAVQGDFKAFLCTATGFGTVGVRKGKPFVKVASGRIVVDRIAFRPAKG